MERIGLLGGTFNPVHLGHLHLAQEFLARLSLSRVLLIPTMSPPHKQEDGLAPAGARLEMCRIAAAGSPGIAVTDIEIRRGGASYTIDTLRELTAQMKNVSFYFIMGADMFLTLEQWKDFEEILKLADICAASRRDGETKTLEAYARVLEKRFGARCHIEEIPVVDLSSTRIRRIIARGGDASAMLPAGVYDYIRRSGLYTEEESNRER